MEPTTLMLIGGSVAAFAFVATVINFALLAKNMGENFVLRLVVHLFLGGLWVGGGVSLIGGFIWFLIDKYNK